MILTEAELLQINIESHAVLEHQAENFTKLFETIAELSAERDEYKRRYEEMINIYQNNIYEDKE